MCRLNLSYFDLVCLASAAPAAFIAIAPIFHYSRYGYRERRQEVLEYFLGKEIVAYYKKFYRARYSEKEEPSASHFAQFYDQRFGWDSYRVPLVGYIVALTVATGWIIGAVLHVKGADDPRFREVAYALIPTFVGIDSSDIVAWRSHCQAKSLNVKVFLQSVRGSGPRTKSHHLRRLV